MKRFPPPFGQSGSLAAQDPLWTPMVDGRFRLGVTGGRGFKDIVTVQWALMMLNLGSRVTVVHGAAPGADSLVQSVVEDLFPPWDFDPFPADWERDCDEECRHGGHRPRRRDGSEWCPAAGPIRNWRMVDSGLDLLLGFEGNNGTNDMLQKARRAGVSILKVGDW